MTKREKHRRILTSIVDHIYTKQPSVGDDLVNAILDAIEDMPRKKKVGTPPGSKVWDSYKEAYTERYLGIEPHRNTTTNVHCKRLVELVGEINAVPLAAFYVRQNDQDLMRDAHPLNYLIAKYQKYNARFQGAVGITSEQSRKVERLGASVTASKNYLEEKHRG